MLRGHGPSRRRFLEWVGAGSTLALPACSSDSAAAPAAFGDAPAGSIATLALGTLREVPGAPAYVGRDADGVYAMTSTCSHEGCDMTADGQLESAGVFCACHGSRFDLNGAVTRGPAKEALAHFAVDVDADGNLVVHGGTRVASAVRTPVVAG
jgi:cytochrome b6-f complex iron-sulfur subunit